MANRSEPPNIVELIDGASIEEWDRKWELVPNGFRLLQSQLRHEVGIFAAKRGKEVMYVGSASQATNGGLRAGLGRGRLKNQTNNSSHGMSMVRKNRDRVEAYVIRFDNPKSRLDDILQLKFAMIGHHLPVWNAPNDIVAAATKGYYTKK